MSFYGKAFAFNSIPCEAYELMAYELGSSDRGGEIASTVTIEEELVGNRQKPYFYGVKHEGKLEIDLVFGANQRRIDEGKYLDRYEIDAIANWLTGHDQYLWLEIEQPDLRMVHYHCICTSLEIVTYGNVPWSLQATFECDSPYGYMDSEEFTYNIYGTQEISFFNRSCANGYYYPEIEIVQSGGTFKIVNETDGDREFALTGYPQAVQHVYVDNDHCIITNDQDLNLYPYFNNKFFRLKKGYNDLVVTGTGTLIIKCMFQVNTGG